METIGVPELEAGASKILRRVQEEGTIFEIIAGGHIVARLVPVPESEPEAPHADPKAADPDFWERWDKLSHEIEAHWPEDVSAVDAVREGRREL